jgi:hypothetical protein
MAKLKKAKKRGCSKLIRTNVFFKDAAALIKVLVKNLMSLLISQYVCRSKKSESNGKRCCNDLMELVKMLKFSISYPRSGSFKQLVLM